MRCISWVISAAAAACVGLPSVAQGVAIAWEQGAGNNTNASIQAAFDDFPYFLNVGRNNIGTAIYLGNGVVLTAGHLTPLGINWPSGGSWSADQSTILNITPEVRLYRLNGNPEDMPNLPSIPIAPTPPQTGDLVIMIGSGFDQAAGSTIWDVSIDQNTNAWTWEEDATPEENAFLSFKALTWPNPNNGSAPRAIRWGTNEADYLANYINPQTNQPYSNIVNGTETFMTVFNATSGTDFTTLNPATTWEAQGYGSDSGGAVFAKINGTWYLAGMMFAVGLYPSQPGSNSLAVDGNITYMANLALYRDQMEAYIFIPEPATAGMLIVGGLALLARRRR
jgi:hypothetical protein